MVQLTGRSFDKSSGAKAAKFVVAADGEKCRQEQQCKSSNVCCCQQSWENDLNNGLLRLSMGGLMFGGTAALETRFKRVTDKRVTC